MELTLALRILNMLQAGTAYLTERGFTRERIQELLDEAAETGSDITPEIVQAELEAH